MTECERLISNGSFTPDFFKEEVRCDFLVTEERKKIWAIQLDLFRQFKEVCDSEGLRYFAIFGTLLGAIRHGGYIPWDDDMDFGMPRDDYDRFCGMQDRFAHPYELQIPGTGDYFYSFAKIRNSETTFMSQAFRHCKFNQGICIDIFPMDKWNYEKGRLSYLEIDRLNRDNSAYLRRGTPNPDEATRQRIMAWSGRHGQENLDRINFLAKQFYGDPAADRLCAAVLTTYAYEKVAFPSCWFEDTKEISFEGGCARMTIPLQYEKILKMNYGDWHQYPPQNQQGTWHSGIVVDTDLPYTEYIG